MWDAVKCSVNSTLMMTQEVASSTPPGRQYSFMEIEHEILSTVILSLKVNQEGQLPVSGENLHNTG